MIQCCLVRRLLIGGAHPSIHASVNRSTSPAIMQGQARAKGSPLVVPSRTVLLFTALLPLTCPLVFLRALLPLALAVETGLSPAPPTDLRLLILLRRTANQNVAILNAVLRCSLLAAHLAVLCWFRVDAERRSGARSLGSIIDYAPGYSSNKQRINELMLRNGLMSAAFFRASSSGFICMMSCLTSHPFP